VIPGERARDYLRSVDPEIPAPPSSRARLAATAISSISLLLVGLTLLAPRHVEAGARASHLAFGHPFRYVVVDNSLHWGADGRQGPFTARFNPTEDVFEFRAGYFLLDWALVAAVLVAPVLVLSRLLP
jgi:hypothetical protein